MKSYACLVLAALAALGSAHQVHKPIKPKPKPKAKAKVVVKKPVKPIAKPAPAPPKPVAPAPPAEPVLKFERKYVAGESDTYTFTSRLDGSMAMETTLTSTQTVKQVYDNGDADIESKPTDVHVKVGPFKRGIKVGATTIRLSKYGTLVNAEKPKKGAPLDFMKYGTMLPKEGIKVGQTIPIDATSENGEHVVGTITLKSMEGGVATLVTSIDATMAGWKEAMHMDFTTLVESATGKATHLEGTASHLPDVAGPMKDSTMTFTMERKAA